MRGQASAGARTIEWTATVSVAPGDAQTSITATSSVGLPNTVACYDMLTITWTTTSPGINARSAGSSAHLCYVVLAAPVSTNYWTLLDISCRAAAGQSTEDAFVRSTFDPFRTSTGDGNGLRRKRDGVRLTYYRDAAATPGSGVYTCTDLLSRADGTGRCGAWANFLFMMHRVHGVTSSAEISVVPVAAPLLIVKNVTFNGAGSQPPPFTHLGGGECVKDPGIAGQGKTNPQCVFGDHALVEHRTGIYDPSYGVGPRPNLKMWEDGGIAGIGTSRPVGFLFAGDRQALPGRCSRGFINYTAVRGDTLASIAARFGIASGAALYNHGYNAALRVLHPPPVASAPETAC